MFIIKDVINGLKYLQHTPQHITLGVVFFIIGLVALAIIPFMIYWYFKFISKRKSLQEISKMKNIKLSLKWTYFWKHIFHIFTILILIVLCIVMFVSTILLLGTWG